MTRLSAVIVNWNSGAQLSAAVESFVRAADRADVDWCLTIVDNASDDGSADFAMTQQGGRINMIVSPSNLGFGKACNVGARSSAEKNGTPDFFLFLNPDTECNDDTLSQLFAEPILSSPRHGVFGIRMTKGEQTSTTCSNFPSLLRMLGRSTGLANILPPINALEHHMLSFDHHHDRDVDQVMGAFFLVRGELFEALDGFDARFFMYYEEVDFCKRALAIGASCHYLATPSIFHARGGTTNSIRPQRLYYNLRSRLQYFSKHFGLLTTSIVAALAFTIEPFARVGRCLMRRDLLGCRDVLRAYALFFFSSPKS